MNNDFSSKTYFCGGLQRKRTSWRYLQCLFIRNMNSIVPTTSSNKLSDAKETVSGDSTLFSFFVFVHWYSAVQKHRYDLFPFFLWFFFASSQPGGLNHLLTFVRAFLNHSFRFREHHERSTDTNDEFYCELYRFSFPFLLITCSLTFHVRIMSINSANSFAQSSSAPFSSRLFCFRFLNPSDCWLNW